MTEVEMRLKVEEYKSNPENVVRFWVRELENTKSLISALYARIRDLEAQLKNQKP
jgi:hypothetical protein